MAVWAIWERVSQFTHGATAPASFIVSQATQNLETRTQEIIDFTELRFPQNPNNGGNLSNNVNYSTALRVAGSKEALHGAMNTGSYCLPFDLRASRSNFAQGFWGVFSHAGGRRGNEVGAIDIGTGSQPNLPLYSVLNGRVIGVSNAGTNSSVWIECTINRTVYVLQYLHIVQNSADHLNVGDTVERGARIGRVGGSPIHLDFRVIENGMNGTRLDPLRFFDMEKQVSFGFY